jgi:hypothetical protein
MMESYGVEWKELVEQIVADFKDMTRTEFKELYESYEKDKKV